MKVEWLTTAPDPRTRATGHDAGQRGWKLHAVPAGATDTFTEVRDRTALCGLRPRHGWDLDMFIVDRCKRCVLKVKQLGR